MQVRFILQQDEKQTTSQEEHEGEDRRPHPKKNMKVKTEDPQTDYYSSDDHSSDSGKESDPLK